MTELLCPARPPPDTILRPSVISAINETPPPHVAAEFIEVVTIIPNRLYFATASKKLSNSKSTKRRFATLNTDDILVYEPFFRDFGPLNLGYVWRFADEFDEIMRDTSSVSELVYYANACVKGKVENAAFLLGCYLIDMLGWSAEEAVEPFLRLKRYELVSFRDASYGSCTYELSLYGCFAGFEKARSLGWYSHETFNLALYEKYEHVSNGDLNWIIPGQFVAFSGPSSPDEPEVEESYNHPPEKYVPIFQKWGVTLVIRLNKKQYNPRVFTKAGIKHIDLYFVDGSCPSDAIVKKFLKICEKHQAQGGAIAVHCKAGLGRTGTLIGCYAIRHYQFKAYQWIAWNRICRPGSVLGPQQQYLHLVEKAAWLTTLPEPDPEAEAVEVEVEVKRVDKPEKGVVKPCRVATPKVAKFDNDTPPIVTPKLLLPSLKALEEQHSAAGLVMSPQDYRVANEGDHGQAERLISAKLKKVSADTPSTTTGRSSAGMHSPRKHSGSSSRPFISPRSQFVQKITDFFSPRRSASDTTRGS